MVQHINLLARRKARKGFLSLSVVALGLLTLLLGAMAAKSEWRIQQLRTQEERTEQTVADLKVALEKKRQTLGLAETQAMTRQVELLRSQVETKRAWADLQSKGELGNANGYSQWLETLAGVHVEGVWLQSLDIGKGGQTMSLQGKALSTDAVMRYIEQVNEAFKPMNVRFGSMEITQDAAAEQSAARSAPTLSFKIQ
jgi:hypothetical protein